MPDIISNKTLEYLKCSIHLWGVLAPPDPNRFPVSNWGPEYLMTSSGPMKLEGRQLVYLDIGAPNAPIRQFFFISGYAISGGFKTTVSGVNPVYDWDLATKLYVDLAVNSISGISGISGSTSLSGLIDVSGIWYSGAIIVYDGSYFTQLSSLSGVQGPQGPTGPQGPQGVQGPPGPSGATGATGSTGSQGIQGPAGPSGAQGLTGPSGAQGLQGPAGPIVGLSGLLDVSGTWTSGKFVSFNGTYFIPTVGGTGGGDLTQAVADTRYVLSGSIADAKYALSGQYITSGYSYTKAESDARYGGGSPNTSGLTLIAEIICDELFSSAGGMLTTSGFGVYDRIEIEAHIKSSAAQANDLMRIYFNGDTNTSNYAWALIYGGGFNGSNYIEYGAAGGDCFISEIPGNTAPGLGPTKIIIMDPGRIGVTKTALATFDQYRSASPVSHLVGNMSVQWNSTAQISGIALAVFTSPNTFTSGSRITVIGYKKRWVYFAS